MQSQANGFAYGSGRKRTTDPQVSGSIYLLNLLRRSFNPASLYVSSHRIPQVRSVDPEARLVDGPRERENNTFDELITRQGT